MKLNRNINENHKETLQLAKDFAKSAFKYGIEKYDEYQLAISLDPIISNACYHRELEVLERERFKTLIALSRTLDDDNLEKTITALNYKITLKEDKK